MNADKAIRKIGLLANMTVENGCSVGEALNAATILVGLHSQLIEAGISLELEIELAAITAINFIDGQTVINQPAESEEPKNETLEDSDLVEDIELVDRVSRTERAAMFEKLYEEIILVASFEEEMNVTQYVQGMATFNFLGSKSYFMSLFRVKAMNDGRIEMRSVRKGGTFCKVK